MEKPILFNTEMVKAILEGRKKNTRRIVKPQPKQLIPLGFISDSTDGKKIGYYGWGKNECGGIIDIAKPPYKVGDVLWVRETWSFQQCSKCNGKCDTKAPDYLGENGCYVYRTNYGKTEDDTFPPSMFKWHPSIHMPRTAARIFLKVTDIRAERLQDITHEGILNEGTIVINSGYDRDNYKFSFSTLWNGTVNKKDIDMYGWRANPWVWVIEFEKMEVEK